MALELRPTSKWFYGRFKANGKTVCKNLGVEIKGKPPKSLKLDGDPAFERSRAKAHAKLDELRLEAQKRGMTEELIQTVHELRTGNRIRSLPLSEMFDAWNKQPRRKKPSKRYVSQTKSIMECFVSFIASDYPRQKEMADIQSASAKAFMLKQDERGISAKTYNNYLILCRSCFTQLKKEAGMYENPFEGIPTKIEETIFRKPFEIEELEKIIEESKKPEHAFIRPIIITGICSAMRRGDCCLLKQNDTDLKNAFITVKTSKTGETVQIPLFPMLLEEINNQPVSNSEYVFPEQAAMYQTNPDGITWRVKQLFKEAFKNEKEVEEPQREHGLRKPSVRDFHSFRVTWVTLALSAGIPLELVQKVTGHRTASIVLKHYYQPGKEIFRKTLQQNMPGLLTSNEKPQATLIDRVKAELEKQTVSNWKQTRNKIINMIDKDTNNTK